MLDVLTTIAKQDTASVKALVEVFTPFASHRDGPVASNEVPFPADVLIAARTLERAAARVAEDIEVWRADLDNRLIKGMSGERLRDLLAVGRALCESGLASVGLATNLWQQAQELGARERHAQRQADGCSGIEDRLKKMNKELLRMSHRLIPDRNLFNWDEADAEKKKGETQIGRGEGLSAVQALEAVRAQK